MIDVGKKDMPNKTAMTGNAMTKKHLLTFLLWGMVFRSPSWMCILPDPWCWGLGPYVSITAGVTHLLNGLSFIWIKYRYELVGIYIIYIYIYILDIHTH